MSVRSERARSRYEMLVKIASGGMATIYVGRARDAGRSELVAIKRPHAHLLDDPSFQRSFLAEADLASRIEHPNVVAVRDLEIADESILLVMDYVEGTSLAELLALGYDAVPREELARVGLRVLLDACAGLHAAHELTDDAGRSLGLVHRDVSPQNVLVGIDGVGCVVDFGIAKCMHLREGSTTTGTVKGKTAYMAPEYLAGRGLDRRGDIFAVGVMLWEVLAGERLFRGQHDAETISRVLGYDPPPISGIAPYCGTRLDGPVGRALSKDPSRRPPTMRVLAEELLAATEGTDLVARHDEVAELLQRVAHERLDARRARLASALARSDEEAPRTEAAPRAPARRLERASGTMPLGPSETRTVRRDGESEDLAFAPTVAAAVPVVTPSRPFAPEPPPSSTAVSPQVTAARGEYPLAQITAVGALFGVVLVAAFLFGTRFREPRAPVSTALTPAASASAAPAASEAPPAESASAAPIASVAPSAPAPSGSVRRRAPRTVTSAASAPDPTPRASVATSAGPRPLPPNPYHR